MNFGECKGTQTQERQTLLVQGMVKNKKKKRERERELGLWKNLKKHLSILSG